MPARKHFFKRLKLEKGVRIPRANEINAPITRILRDMKVGDSVLVETKKEAVSLRVILGRLGFKVTRRKVDEGFRTWRVK